MQLLHSVQQRAADSVTIRTTATNTPVSADGDDEEAPGSHPYRSQPPRDLSGLFDAGFDVDLQLSQGALDDGLEARLAFDDEHREDDEDDDNDQLHAPDARITQQQLQRHASQHPHRLQLQQAVHGDEDDEEEDEDDEDDDTDGEVNVNDEHGAEEEDDDEDDDDVDGLSGTDEEDDNVIMTEQLDGGHRHGNPRSRFSSALAAAAVPALLPVSAVPAVRDEKLDGRDGFLLLNPYSPFLQPSQPAAATCDCHRASQSSLSSIPVASISTSSSSSSSSFSFTPPSTCHRPSCSLASALSLLRQSEKMADVCFLVGGAETEESKEESKQQQLLPLHSASASASCAPARIFAHRTVLSSRSSVFDRMFNGNMLESRHRRRSSGSASSSSSSPSSLSEVEEDVLVVSVPDIAPAAFRLMLDFIYLDHVPQPQTSEKHAGTVLHYPSLLYASTKYDLPRLQGAVRTALHTVIPSIACQLWQSLLTMREDDLAVKYHRYILQHASSLLLTEGFQSLPLPLLLELVEDDRLQVGELQLFKALYKWTERQVEAKAEQAQAAGIGLMLDDWKQESREQRVQQSFKQQLLPHIRFPLMSARDLAVHIAPSRLLTDAELAALFIFISSNRQSPLPAGVKSSPRVACPSVISLPYHHDGDEHGLVYWLGTSGYTVPFTNPHLINAVAITLSSLQFGTPSSLTSRRRDVQLWTHNRASSWVELDIDPLNVGRTLIPSHLSLQHGYDRPLDSLCNWALEASCNRWDWDMLLEKRGVVAFRDGHERRTWALPVTVTKAYRMFRIRGLGRDSSDRTEYVCIGGLELYGELIVMEGTEAGRGRADEEESKGGGGGGGEKRQREEMQGPGEEDRGDVRRHVDRPQPAAGAGGGLAADGEGRLELDGGRVSDVTAAVDEERRCWKAARQCCLM